jgi:hypothetical protein
MSVRILRRVILAGPLTGGMLIGGVLFLFNLATASASPHEVFFPLVLKQSPLPEIRIYNIQPETFPLPYGYGLTIEYEYSNLDDIQGRTADYVTTQYSPDGGITWYTDESHRSPVYRWDNIHGDISCGLAAYNLKSNHTYSLRIILTWHDDRGTYQSFSNSVEAITEAYDCQDLDQDQVPDTLEQSLAEKFFPDLWVRWQVSDRQQFYAFQDIHNGSIPYTVQPYISNFYVAGVDQSLSPTYGSYCDSNNFQCLEIRYGLAYVWDCGDDPKNGCSGINNHLGDTEFYAVLVAREGADQSWSTPWEIAKEDVNAWHQVLSETFAHWNTITDSSRCHYYISPRATRATLYVAEGKHATYHSVRDCDRGGLFGSDYCVDEAHGGMNLRNDLAALELQNIGNPEEHFLFDTKILQPSNPSQKTYDMWSGEGFGSVGAYQDPFIEGFPWGYWWWYNSPQGSDCGDLCSCRSGD